MIDDWIPDPSIGAGAPRAAQLLRALIETGAAVTHFSTSHSPAGKSVNKRSIDGATFLCQQGNRSYTLRQFLAKFHDRFAVILISRPHNMEAFSTARSQVLTIKRKPILIYDAEAIFSERDTLKNAVFGRPVAEAATRALINSEIDLSKAVDVVLTVNEQNASLFRSAGRADVRVLRHAVADQFGCTTHRKRNTILFVGPTYSDDTPNTDSVVWFVDNVLPLMRQQRNESFRLTLAGRSAAAAIAAIPNESLDFLGPLPSLQDEYAQALVFVAPTRFAAGIPLKVYEAAAHGVPSVITSLLAAQLDWRDEIEALVADTPAHFAQQCLRLMEDEVLWARLRVAAHDRTLRECDFAMFQTTVRSLLSPMLPTLNQAISTENEHDSAG